MIKWIRIKMAKVRFAWNRNMMHAYELMRDNGEITDELAHERISMHLEKMREAVETMTTLGGYIPFHECVKQRDLYEKLNSK